MSVGPLRGLRGQTVAALVLTAIVTLLAATVALLSPLERRLRAAELQSLAAAGNAARPALGRLGPTQLRNSSTALRGTVRALRRRTGGTIIVLGPRGRIVFATDIDSGQRFPAASQALATGRTVEGTLGGDEPEALVAVPFPVGAARGAVILVRPLDTVRSASAVVRRALVAAGLLGLGVAVLLGLLLSGRLVRRLGRLRRTATAVAEFGPIAELEADDRRDEVGDLTRAFATMQTRLRDQEHARRAFVATASHELRTPITSLALMLELVAEELDSPRADLNDVRSEVKRARMQTERLKNLAAELLDLSRIDAGLTLRAEIVDVPEICRAVLAEFAPRASAVSVDQRLFETGARWAIADPDATARIVRILIDNALRFAPAGTALEIDVAMSDAGLCIAVKDAGPGVPYEDRGRIFERFERGSDASHPGFGLGLAIGRELARAMDGELELGPSMEGARFLLTLPSAPTEDLSDAMGEAERGPGAEI